MDYPNSIIFAEDNPQDLRLFKYALAQVEQEINLIHFENGRACLDALPGIYPASISCILVDLNMPIVNGFDLIAGLRQNEDFAHTPIIIFTSTNSNEEKLRCYQLGANAYVSKPLEIEELVEVVNNIVHFWIDTNARVM